MMKYLWRLLQAQTQQKQTVKMVYPLLSARKLIYFSKAHEGDRLCADGFKRVAGW